MKLSRKKLVKKLDKVFSEYIRQRYAVGNIATCVTCGKKDNWKKLQAGHFISRKHYSTRWDTTNVQVQCSGCNVFRYGEQYKFGIYLDQQYGIGTADELLKKSRKLNKLTNQDLLDLIEQYA